MTTDERIEKLDLSVFGHISTTTPPEDQLTLLALQTAFRRKFPGYAYLEIGSFKGGSLQPYVVDANCAKIISIDPRPAITPDVRGIEQYGKCGDFSVEGMLKALGQIPGADMSKVKTYETTASEMDGNAMGVRPHLCFVDGEHTNSAVLTDARFCCSVLAENGAIAFHDANLVFRGLQSFLEELTAAGRSFRAHVLPDSIFLVEFGSIHFCELEPLRGRLQENYKAYFAGMVANDWYRVSYNMPVYRIMRKIRRLFPKRQ